MLNPILALIELPGNYQKRMWKLRVQKCVWKVRYIILANVISRTLNNGRRCLLTYAIVSFALPCSRQAVTMHVTFHRRRIYIRAPANGGSGIDAYGWLPTTGERIVTSRIVHVAEACNDRSPVVAAGTTTPVTTVRNFSASRRDVSRADKLLDLSCARATRLIQFVSGAIAQRGGHGPLTWHSYRRRLRWRMENHDRLEAHRVD